MRTVNKVTLIWNIARDPLVKITESWKKVAMFTVATNRQYRDSNDEVKSESEFSNCVAWGILAERIEKYLIKWKLVYIEGRLKTRIIEKEDKTKTYKTEIVVSSLIFLNKKTDFENLEEDFDDEISENEFKF